MACTWRRLAVAAAAALLLAPAPAPAAVQKQVLILWGGRSDLPVNVVVNSAIRAALFESFGADVDLRFEYVPGGRGADKRLLDNILGFGVIAQNGARDPVKPAVEALRQGTNRGFVALTRPAFDTQPSGFVVEAPAGGIRAVFGPVVKLP